MGHTGRRGARENGAASRPVLLSTVLTALFNLVALNLSLVVVSLGVLTIPSALAAASAAVYRWRVLGDSRVLLAFWSSLIDRPLYKSAVLGPPLAGLAIGVSEIFFFDKGGFVSAVCLLIGFSTCAVALSVASYASLFLAASHDVGTRILWSTAITATGRTAATAVPIFVVETTVATVVGLADPGLVVVAIPIVLLLASQPVAIWGTKRAGLDSNDPLPR